MIDHDRSSKPTKDIYLIKREMVLMNDYEIRICRSDKYSSIVEIPDDEVNVTFELGQNDSDRLRRNSEKC